MHVCMNAYPNVTMLLQDEKANTLVKTYERGYPVGFKASLEVHPALMIL